MSPLYTCRPQCKLFLEDMLCCEDAGIVNNRPWATVQMLCTHNVNMFAKCLAVDGPSNVTVVDPTNTVWAQAHRYTVSYEDDASFTGAATVDVQAARCRFYHRGLSG